MDMARKIGDDWPFHAIICSGITKLPIGDAVVTWKLIDRAEATVIGGDATVYDAPTGRFQLMVPKDITDNFGVHEGFRLDVCAVHLGKSITRSVNIVATNNVSACLS